MRQPPVTNSIAQEARGLINRQESCRQFSLERFAPCAELQHVIEHYWLVQWDLTDRPDYLQQNLPHPSPHLVIDPQGQSGVRGLVRHRFQYRLTGKGRVFGVKFLPGGFSAFFDRSIAELTGARLPLADFWGEHHRPWETKLNAATNFSSYAAEVEQKLAGMAKPLPEAALRAQRLVQAIASDAQLESLEALSAYAGQSVRSLQRLFKHYVGVSPKWVIDRYRMIEAVEAINNNVCVDLTELAHRLGYFDQAHFSKAFSALVGVPPSQCKPLPSRQM